MEKPDKPYLIKTLKHLLIVKWILAAMFCIPVAILYPESSVTAAHKKAPEYQVKVAYIYSFLKFISWPETGDEIAGTSDSITVGFFSRDVYSAAKKIIEGKVIKRNGETRKISTRYLTVEDTEDLMELKKCRVLFFSSDQRMNNEKILAAIRESDVLTLGESEQFLDNGGIIRFVNENKRIRFEINIEAAKVAGLEIRSKLLKLARNVVCN